MGLRFVAFAVCCLVKVFLYLFLRVFSELDSEFRFKLRVEF